MEQALAEHASYKSYRKRSRLPGFRWCSLCQAEKAEAEFSPTNITYCKWCTSLRWMISRGLTLEQAIAELEDKRTLGIIGLKRCSECRQIKLSADFALRTKCKDCDRKRKRDWYVEVAAHYGNVRSSLKGMRHWAFIEAWIMKEFDNRCCYCGNRHDKIGIDHVVPVSKKGTNALRNLAPACGRCNRHKYNKTLEDLIGKDLAKILTDRLIRMEREILEALYQRDVEEQEAEKAEHGSGRISELVCEAVG
jgi:hypothetical protein